MRHFVTSLLGVILALAAYWNGGVAEEWLWLAAGIGCICGTYWALVRREKNDGIGRLALALMVVIGASVLWTVVPLPNRIVGWLSPTRAAMLEVARGAGIGTEWTTLSMAPLQTVWYVVSGVAYLLVFQTVRRLTRESEESETWFLVALPIVVVGVLEGILGFLQAISPHGDGHARGTLSAYDHYSGLLEMALPFPLLYGAQLILKGRRRHESPGWPAFGASVLFLGFVLILIGVIHSLSRSGFLSALGALFVVGLGFVASRRPPGISNRVDQLRNWPAVVGLGVMFLFLLVFLPTDSLLARFGVMSNGEHLNDDRWLIWRDSLPMVKAFPLFGVGLGGYETSFHQYKVVAPMQTVDYAHNDYLQLLIELGLVGFVPCLMLLGLVLYCAVRGLFRTEREGKRLFLLACVASLSGILFHSLTDFNLYVPVNGLLFFWVLGMAGSELRGRRSY